jgi:hypothetical protein
MSEIEFLMTNAERIALLRKVLEEGAAIIPDKQYAEKKCSLITSLDQIDDLLDHRLYFVLRSDWKVEDLVMRSFSKDGQETYHLAQRYGGPTINMLLYPEGSLDGQPVLGRGSLHYYPFYYSGIDGAHLDPPKAMKDFFSNMSRFVKTGAVRLVGRVRSSWLSKSSLEAVSAGRIRLPSEWSIDQVATR